MSHSSDAKILSAQISFHDDDNDELSPLPCGPKSHDSNLGRMKLGLPSLNLSFDQDVLSNFIKYNNSPEQRSLIKSHNTTEDIAVSLGIVQNESVGWTSALETPHNCEKKIKKLCCSTLERVTHCPSCKLHQSVLPRALFSPLGENCNEGSKQCTADSLSPLAKNLEASQNKLIGTNDKSVIKLEESDNNLMARESFNNNNGIGISNDDNISPYKSFTSKTLTSTPLSVNNSEYKITNHLRKCLDDAFKGISPTSCKVRSLAENKNISINVSGKFDGHSDQKIRHSSLVEKDYGHKIKDDAITASSISGICELEFPSISSIVEKNNEPPKSALNIKSKLSLKRKKLSKFIYPIPDGVLDCDHIINNDMLLHKNIGNSSCDFSTNGSLNQPAVADQTSDEKVDSDNKFINDKISMHAEQTDNMTCNKMPCKRALNSSYVADDSTFDEKELVNSVPIIAHDTSVENLDNAANVLVPVNEVTNYNTCNKEKHEEEEANSINKLISANFQSVSEISLNAQKTMQCKSSLNVHKAMQCESSLYVQKPMQCENSLNRLENIKLDESDRFSRQSNFFTGFQSGSGKNIEVSHASMKNVQNIWNDLNNSEEHLEQLNLSHSDVGLSEPFDFSKISLQNNPPCSDGSVKNLTSFHYKDDPEFKTGFGEKCDIVKTCVINKQKLDKPVKSTLKLHSEAGTGFQTVSGKKITVAETSLKFVQSILEDCVKLEENSSKYDQEIETTRACTLSSLVNSSYVVGSNILEPVINNNVAQHKITACTEIKKVVNDISIESKKSSVPCHDLGVLTPIKKKVEAEIESSNSLANKDLALINCSQIDFSQNIILSKRPSQPERKMASPETTSLPRSERLAVNGFVQMQVKDNAKPNFGFQTANNKPVEISKVALLKAKLLFENTEGEGINDCDVDSCNVPNFNKEFLIIENCSSGSNAVKNYNVETRVSKSQTSIESNDCRSLSPVFGSYRTKHSSLRPKSKRRSLVNDFNCVKLKPAFVGHKSSNENASFDAKSVNEDLNKIEDRPTLKSNLAIKFSFVTGQGTNVQVKEESLILAKGLLNPESVSEITNDLNNKDIFQATREVPDISTTSINDENKFNNLKSGKQNKTYYFDTQDFLEIKNVSEAFMLDNSWEDVTYQPSSTPTLKRSGTELLENPNIKKKKIEDTAVEDGKERNAARQDQAEIIRAKPGINLDKLHGLLYQMKTNDSFQKFKMSVFNLNKNCAIDPSSNLADNISYCDASLWRFDIEDRKSVFIEPCDGFKIIPGCDNKIGVKEVENSFLASKFINSTIVPSKWVANHYQLIIWKLASYQRKMECFTQKPFSLIETLQQLRFRYDLEVLEGRRSFIRKIFEQDDIPQKTMILCVAEVNIDSGKNDSSSSPLLLTDGWYSIGAQIDNSMRNLLQRKVIKVGFKLILHGSEFAGTPSPCHPLEDDGTVQLKIHTNMIRIAPWHSKLGLFARGGPIPSTKISCIMDGGGLVGTLDVIIARKYPLIYMAKYCGKTIMHNERTFEKRAQDFEIQKQTLLQKIYCQVEKEMDDREDNSQKYENAMRDLDFLKELPIKEEIRKNITSISDFSNFESLLTSEQLMEVQRWKQHERDKKQSSIQKEVRKRFSKENKLFESVPMLKLGVVDKTGDYAVLTIWRPQEDIVQLLKEEKSYRIHFVSAAEMRMGIKHLTWNKHSRIRDIGDIATDRKIHQRKVTAFDQINVNTEHIPWSEMDVVGIVVLIAEPKDGRQVVYLADKCSNILSLKFWPSVHDYGVSNILEIGTIVSVCNASWKGKTEDIPTLHITSHTVISTTFTKQYLIDSVSIIKDQDISSILACANSRIEELSSEFVSEHESTRQPTSPKFIRTEIKRTKEFEGKIQSLKRLYGVSSPVRAIHLKSSPHIAKPFRVPLLHVKNPLNDK